MDTARQQKAYSSWTGGDPGNFSLVHSSLLCSLVPVALAVLQIPLSRQRCTYCMIPTVLSRGPHCRLNLDKRWRSGIAGVSTPCQRYWLPFKGSIFTSWVESKSLPCKQWKFSGFLFSGGSGPFGLRLRRNGRCRSWAYCGTNVMAMGAQM